MTTDSKQDYVQQRIEAIEKFETTNAEYILFLNNSVILSNANILSTLVKHNQAVIAPMIRMNLFKPSYRNIFKYGYNESSDITELFPNTEKFRKSWRHDRFYVCMINSFIKYILYFIFDQNLYVCFCSEVPIMYCMKPKK